jgi:hypothetical protein
METQNLKNHSGSADFDLIWSGIGTPYFMKLQEHHHQKNHHVVDYSDYKNVVR